MGALSTSTEVTNITPRFRTDPPTPGHRRRFSVNQKLDILRETSEEGETISSVGRRHHLSASLLFRWRRSLAEAGYKVPGLSAPDQAMEAAVVHDTQEDPNEDRARVAELERIIGRQAIELERLRHQLAEAGTQRRKNDGARVEHGTA